MATSHVQIVKKPVSSFLARQEDAARGNNPIADVVTGTTGNDTLFDTAGNDQIDALDGDDSITVTNGQDTVGGGTGSDRLIVNYAAATAGLQVQSAPSANAPLGGFNGAWNDFAGRGVSYSSIEHFTISTGSGNDSFATASGNDVVSLGLGNDLVNVGTGIDQGDGGGGEDGISADMSAASGAILWNLLANTFSGPVGTSFVNFEYFGTVSTGGGNDLVTTSAVARNELINLGGGDDSATVLNGQDTVNGGSGSDRLIIDYSAATNNLVTANGPTANGVLGGFDGSYSNFAGRAASYNSIEHFTISSGSGIDNITTAAGDDVISTGTGNDTINAGNGNDLLNAGLGSDNANGGLGRDRLVVDYSAATTAVNTQVGPSPSGSGGFDGRYVDAAGNLVIYTSIEDFTLTSGSGFDNIVTASGNDVISTGLGNDTIDAGAGDDFLDGGVGNDSMTGGMGNDTYVVDSAGDAITESFGQGTDEIRTVLANYNLVFTANVENLTGTSNAGQSLTGSNDANVITGAGGNDVLDGIGGNDTLIGNGGNDSLNGGSGDDAMTGGAGNDTYFVDSGSDTVFENAGEGTDEVRTFLASYSIAALGNLENLTGIGGAQVLTGNGGANVITGAGSNDQLFGGDGNDTLFGNVGADLLDGGLGDDAMTGGLGNDNYVVDSTGDTVIENAGEGIEQISTALASYSLAALVNVENLAGTAATGQSLTGNDGVNTIFGSNSGDDQLFGNGGVDSLFGRGGNDMLDGGAGIDAMIGGLGDDSYVVDTTSDVVTENAGEGTDTIRTALASYTLNSANVENLTGTSSANQSLTGDGNANVITGAGGDDLLYGSGGNDTLFGNGGNDQLDGGLGDDAMTGGLGSDLYFVDSLGDTVIENAGEGTDQINTALASYSLMGLVNVENLIGTGTTAQSLTGNNAGNTVVGGSGNDTLDGGANSDTMAGRAGDDIYYVDSLFDRVIENDNEGTDEIRTALSSYTLASANVENLTGTNAAGQSLTGSAGANVITGAAGDDFIVGGGGDDQIIAGGGNDRLYGGTGADTMTGGAGNDIYVVDDAADTLIEAANEGLDSVFTSLNWTLASEFERLGVSDFGTTNAIDLTGNAVANEMWGNDGANVLDGAGDADLMYGFAGDDIYRVDNAGDIVIELSNQGTDTVTTTVSYTIAHDIEKLLVSDSASAGAINLTGNETANEITGNAGANLIDGGAGADTMTGLGGDDFYIVDDAGDTIVEGSSDGRDTVFTSISGTLDSELERLGVNGFSTTYAIDLTGNGLDNELWGNDGANVIDGMAGADVMYGYSGNDTYYVDDAGDAVIELLDQGFDTVVTSIDYTLNHDLDKLAVNGASTTFAINLGGNELANEITGNDGANFIDGGAGSDLMTGLGGDDFYIVDDGEDAVVEAVDGGLDTVFTSISATLGNDVERLGVNGFSTTFAIDLTGNGQDNEMWGNDGANTLDGKAGSDIIYGYGGADTFAFTTALGASNIDQLVDFTVGSDIIALDDAVFTGLATGALAAGAFHTGSAAQDADDRIIYDSATGALYFDADGTGDGAAVQFATLHEGLSLTASDFMVI